MPFLVSRLRLLLLAVTAIVGAVTLTGLAQQAADIRPVSDAVLQDPDPGDWVNWRRTLDGWGFRCGLLLND